MPGPGVCAHIPQLRKNNLTQFTKLSKERQVSMVERSMRQPLLGSCSNKGTQRYGTHMQQLFLLTM